MKALERRKGVAEKDVETRLENGPIGHQTSGGASSKRSAIDPIMKWKEILDSEEAPTCEVYPTLEGARQHADSHGCQSPRRVGDVRRPHLDYINGSRPPQTPRDRRLHARPDAGEAVSGAFFNVSAAFTLGHRLADCWRGLVDISIVASRDIRRAYRRRVDIITCYYGLPTSSSHALIGALAGAAIAKAGFGAIIVAGWTKTLIFIVLAPLIGLGLGFLLMVAILWTFHGTSPGKVDHWFRRLQLLSAAAYSLGHGGNARRKRWGHAACWWQGDNSVTERPYRSGAGGARGDCESGRVGRLAHHPHMGSKIPSCSRRSFDAETAGANVSLFTAKHMGAGQYHAHDHGAIIGGVDKRLPRRGALPADVWAWV